MSVKVLRQCLTDYCWQTAHELLTCAELLDDNADPIKLKITLRRMAILNIVERREAVQWDATMRSIRLMFLYRLPPKPYVMVRAKRFPLSHVRLLALIDRASRSGAATSSGSISTYPAARTTRPTLRFSGMPVG